MAGSVTIQLSKPVFFYVNVVTGIIRQLNHDQATGLTATGTNNHFITESQWFMDTVWWLFPPQLAKQQGGKKPKRRGEGEGGDLVVSASYMQNHSGGGNVALG